MITFVVTDVRRIGHNLSVDKKYEIYIMIPFITHDLERMQEKNRNKIQAVLSSMNIKYS